MEKVYYSRNLDPIVDRIDLSLLGRKVAIKVHFGEKGCNTYLDPEIARKVFSRIASAGKEAALVECNVLYKGSRVNSALHIATAREHGFTGMPIDILDGENGNAYVEIEGCKLGKGVLAYDSLVVISHFKGHMAAGFGGAIKNVGMGLGSRAGKLYMHSAMKPSIAADKCLACGACAEHCNAAAVSLAGGRAAIDQEKCEGCAMCIAVCPAQAVEIPWAGRTNEDLQKKTAEYAKAVLTRFPGAVFINVLNNITEHCDCMGMHQDPFMQDVGFLSAGNLVAIDKASLDLAEEYSSGRFGKINIVDKYAQIRAASELGLGSAEYELVSI